jgi:hypothetical protein
MFKSLLAPTFAISSLFSFSFPPMCEDTPDAIDFRVSVAHSSIGMVKYYLEEISCNAQDPQMVCDAVCMAMKYLWNADVCLGEPFAPYERVFTSTLPDKGEEENGL